MFECRSSFVDRFQRAGSLGPSVGHSQYHGCLGLGPRLGNGQSWTNTREWGVNANWTDLLTQLILHSFPKECTFNMSLISL